MKPSTQPVSEQLLYSFGDFAYRKCVEWFGTPRDPQKTWRIEFSDCIALARHRLTRDYILLVPQSLTYEEKFYAAIGHEMYHRVTHLRTGARKALWIDEVLAFLASQKLLEEYGFTAYAVQRLESRQSAALILDIDVLVSARSTRLPFGLSEPRYPAGFEEGVAVVGVQMEHIAEWPAMCRLVASPSLEDWVDSLPIGAAASLKSMLPLRSCG